MGEGCKSGERGLGKSFAERRIYCAAVFQESFAGESPAVPAFPDNRAETPCFRRRRRCAGRDISVLCGVSQCCAALDLAPGQQREPALDQVEPGAGSRREVQMKAGMVRKPRPYRRRNVSEVDMPLFKSGRKSTWQTWRIAYRQSFFQPVTVRKAASQSRAKRAMLKRSRA